MQAHTNINSARDNTFTAPELSNTLIKTLSMIAIIYGGLLINLGFIVLVAWKTGLPIVW